MQALGSAVLFLAVGLYLWNESLFLIAWGALGGFVTGLALVAIFRRNEAPSQTPDGMTIIDPAMARLLDMGFRPDEIAGPLAKARQTGNGDPVAYVLGVLIR